MQEDYTDDYEEKEMRNKLNGTDLQLKRPDELAAKEIRSDMIKKWQSIYFSDTVTMITLLDHEDAAELTASEKKYLLEWSGDDDYAHIDSDGKVIY